MRSPIHFIVISLSILFIAVSANAQDKEAEAQIRKAFEAVELPGLHSVLVTLKGAKFVEVYFDGKDERWGRALGVVKHGPDTLHDLRSVSKSIVSLLYGIALSEGKVPKVSASLVEQFPEYGDLAKDEARKKITIADALTMRMGTEWDESLPYSDPRNSEIAMERSKDKFRYVLDRPIILEPGKKWIYNGGATAIIGELIARGTNIPLDEYADEKLFKPLGIVNFEWVKGFDGTPSAASGLRLTPHGLAKIGQMIANGGKLDGNQIVPKRWLDDSFKPHSKTSGSLRYGYQWYLAPQGDPPVWISGFGNGGQRITIQPKLGLVAVFFAGNYNNPNAWKVPVTVIEKYLSPAIKKRANSK